MYQSVWEKTFPWLERDPDSICKARCKWCHTTFIVEHQGKSALQQHQDKKKHQAVTNSVVEKQSQDNVLLYDIRRSFNNPLSLEEKTL